MATPPTRLHEPGLALAPDLTESTSGAGAVARENICEPAEPTAIAIENLSLWYGQKRALSNVSLNFPQNRVTALIGPSGCGKSTLLRCINRMNDLIPSVRTEGAVRYRGIDVYGREVDPVEVRRRIGMVFQKPNPFPKSIYDNVAFGARVNGYRGNLDDLVEQSLRRAALWDEVKDDLKKSGLALSGGQQQRLCIARAVANNPDVILMDEPCSALDPIATLKIEDLMRELVRDYTIIIVTHNMQQAARVSDYTAFMLTDEQTPGQLIEYAPTSQLFTQPRDRRTEDYISGRFG
ncbi:MAG: phosphate ABC transporter ATP-binding protein PstB [Dehalococcoidia bacterium]